MDGPTTGDAFGELLRLAHDGHDVLGVIERDDGLVEVHDPRIYFTGPDEWDALDRLACQRAVGHVLDVGCGAGRHSLHLQAEGREVTAIDVSPGACQVARARGVRRVHQVRLEDVTSLGERFDTFLLLGNNLALLGSPGRAQAALAALAAVAAPDARILGRNRDPYVTEDPLHTAYHACNRAHGRLGGQTRIRCRVGRLADRWLDYLFCSQDELVDLLTTSPWQLAALDSDGPDYLAELRLR
ncbi:class I SAM-dependent methyltransferase [Thermasporomyces composti]|jgi:SAM-dependent methyltransferase|uniref:Methyltransferase family protein n=1 Tax=Thermasporomyces composti TaxID=696763 RepID=A0A3D9V8T9_THECX|nr:class I SAM-dependent methyltransferase [Thermasporomyces composti]REF37937.1 methyltransferase family protein [Thermasporomyces composti]